MGCLVQCVSVCVCVWFAPLAASRSSFSLHACVALLLLLLFAQHMLAICNVRRTCLLVRVCVSIHLEKNQHVQDVIFKFMRI